MFCPKCEYKYVEGVTVCAHCNVVLIDEKLILQEDKKIFAGF